MVKEDLIKISIHEIYSKPAMRNFPTNKTNYNRIDEIWSIDLADMIDYKISKSEGFRYIFANFDNFFEYTWYIHIMKNKYSQTIVQEISNVLTKSKRSPLKLESDRGKEWYISLFQILWKVQNIHHFSRFSDKGPLIRERVINNE